MDNAVFKKLINTKCPDFKGEIKWLKNTDSTNIQAKDFAVHGLECLIVAEEQADGRGRYDRTFESNIGGLYMSLCLKISREKLDLIADEAGPEDNASFAIGERLIKYPIQAGTAVASALEKIYGVKFDIKLPNDILLNGKKVCGILMEAVHHDDDIFLIFGIGVNIENPLSEELANAASIFELTGQRKSREEVCYFIVSEIIGIL